MIILEGVDKSGKTTLANELAVRYKLPIKHFGIPIPGSDPCKDYSSEMRYVYEPAIYDRFLYGELVYSKVKKRETTMNTHGFYCLDMMLASVPHVVIWCRPEWEEVQRRLLLEPDGYVNIGEARQIYEEYDERMYDLAANVVMYDGTNKDTVIKACDQVMDKKAWETFLHWKHQGMPGIGTLNPDILIVGERYNFAAKYQITFWSKSGAYLFDAFRDLGISFKKLHFTNSISPQLTQITKEQIKLLNPRVILPLGNVSQTVVKVATNQMWPRIPHPSYYSRFRSGDARSYALLLRRACRL